MTTERLKVVHDELEGEIKLAQARARPQEAAVDDLARLSAEAVQATYTAMAKSVETMKGPLQDRTTKLEAALRGLDEALKRVDEFIAKINDTGHLVAAQIDEANALATEVTKMVDDYVAKVK